jgi:glycine oxidase
MTPSVRTGSSGDVIVVGDGLVALSIAYTLASRGIASHVIGERLPGAASTAAAGLLSPSGNAVSESVRTFMNAGRDLYPSFVARLQHDTGRSVLLNRLGILELALDDDELALLAEHAQGRTEVLEQVELAELEPSLSHARGALLYPESGFVDNRALLSALDDFVARSRRVRRTLSRIDAIDLQRPAAVITSTGDRVEADTVILAAGAWSSGLRGLPRPLLITPLRGQMLAVDGQPLTHAVMSTHGYLIPRDESLLVGATVEPGTFESQPTSAGIRALRDALRWMCPTHADAPERARWAGVRPATPDMLPIIDRDRESPSLIYACGHAKNGILLAPITADCVADLVTGNSSKHDLRPFSMARFEE